jgi:putative addiction module component (TIGR02574 family)
MDHRPPALAPDANPADLTSMATEPAFDYRRLSIAERLQLVEDIWDSIATDADAESLPVSEADKVLLDERMAEQDASPGTGAPWPEVRARIVKRPR